MEGLLKGYARMAEGCLEWCTAWDAGCWSGADGGYPEGDERRGAQGGMGVHREGFRAGCRAPRPSRPLDPPLAGAVRRRGRGSSRPYPVRGEPQPVPRWRGEPWPGKAAAEIYDAGGQTVKAVYHHQVGLKERKHTFNKKRGFAIQLRC